MFIMIFETVVSVCVVININRAMQTPGHCYDVTTGSSTKHADKSPWRRRVVVVVPQIDTVGGKFIGGFMLWKRMTRIEGIGNPLLILTASQPFL